MPRFALALALLGIAGFFVSAEVLLHPEIFDSAQQFQDDKKVSDESSDDAKKDVKEDVPDAKNLFALSKLRESGVTLTQGRYSLALFQHAPIISTRDSFYLATFAFQIDGKPIGTVSRVLPTYDVSAGRLLSLVRQKLQSIIPHSQKNQLFLSEALKTIGEANFYLNDRVSFPKTIFLVTRSKTKVLAFQYPTEYHELVKNYIPLFFE